MVSSSRMSSSKRKEPKIASSLEDNVNECQVPFKKEILEEPPFHVLLTTYIGYVVIILFGHLRDICGKTFLRSSYQYLREHNGYAPLLTGFESFYTRRLYMRIRDCWNRPIAGVPTRVVTLLDRKSDDSNKTFQLTGSLTTALNLSSYNYLGFAENNGPCIASDLQALEKYGVGTCSSRMEVGTSIVHCELDRVVARFLGTEDAITFGMGFATNSTAIPAFVDANCLIISDELNHSSLVYGARTSGARIIVFKHDNIEDLEAILRSSIAQGEPRTRRPWKKILVIVESLYSMEGTICNLPALIALKRKYPFFLYVDEAHSIGALGPRGRGICDHYGIDPSEVDILMGTFTKSFGASGGYIAGPKTLINHLRTQSHGNVYAESMAPVVCQQIICAMRLLMGEDGTTEGLLRIRRLHENCLYMRRELQLMGFIIYGTDASPVIPLLLFNPGKIPSFSRECLKRNVAVVVVGYPATSIVHSRSRICISAAHTREDLNYALRVFDEVGDILQLKVSQLFKKEASLIKEPREWQLQQNDIFQQNKKQAFKSPYLSTLLGKDKREVMGNGPVGKKTLQRKEKKN